MPTPAEIDAWPARVQRQLAEFARERDWARFHDPRSLLLALVGEVGELAELYQWQTGIDRTRPR
jgi:dCTP diphosphatase